MITNCMLPLQHTDMIMNQLCLFFSIFSLYLGSSLLVHMQYCNYRDESERTVTVFAEDSGIERGCTAYCSRLHDSAEDQRGAEEEGSRSRDPSRADDEKVKRSSPHGMQHM